MNRFSSNKGLIRLRNTPNMYQKYRGLCSGLSTSGFGEQHLNASAVVGSDGVPGAWFLEPSSGRQGSPDGREPVTPERGARIFKKQTRSHGQVFFLSPSVWMRFWEPRLPPFLFGTPSNVTPGRGFWTLRGVRPPSKVTDRSVQGRETNRTNRDDQRKRCSASGVQESMQLL